MRKLTRQQIREALDGWSIRFRTGQTPDEISFLVEEFYEDLVDEISADGFDAAVKAVRKRAKTGYLLQVFDILDARDNAPPSRGEMLSLPVPEVGDRISEDQARRHKDCLWILGKAIAKKISFGEALSRQEKILERPLKIDEWGGESHEE